jgi:hypothetical protein
MVNQQIGANPHLIYGECGHSLREDRGDQLRMAICK